MNLTDIAREFKSLPLSLIDEPALPARSSMSDEKMDELVMSIRTIGLVQPMIVARFGERFEVIAGHRRWHACHRAGLVEAICLIYPDKAAALDAIQHAENRHREDLNAADEAIWFSELLEQKYDGDVDVLCARLGEKRAYAEGRLNLFAGDPDVFDRLRRGLIQIGVAQALNKCTDQLTRRAYLHNAIVGGATVAVVNGWLMQWKRNQLATGPQEVSSEPAAMPGPVPQTNYFTCYVCQGTDNVHLMQPVNVHSYCLMAVLDQLLARYRGEA